MPGKPSGSEIQTKPLDPSAVPNISKIYVIAYLRWAREWYETFEVSRAKLLNILSHLNDDMAKETNAPNRYIKYFLLSGQTVTLEDIAAVRPDLLTMLIIYNAAGRLAVGPWYVNVDEALVSGESLIRNLLAARKDTMRHGLKPQPVAYAPDSIGHTAQLPQILRGFGMNTAFMRHGAPSVHVPFRWLAPDGSSILLVNYEAGDMWPPQSKDTIVSIEEQKDVHPDGPYLWLYDVGSELRPLPDRILEVADQTGMRVWENDLPGYIHALRHELPDGMRPSLSGELRSQSMQEGVFLLPGTLSARLYLKQANARVQSLLTYGVEPWLAVALTHGHMAYPENAKALLNYCWRILLRNQSTHALRGTASDEVHRENEIQYSKVEGAASQIIADVLDALPGTPHQPGTPIEANSTYVVVWNALNWPFKQMVEVQLEIPSGMYPDELISAQGEVMPFMWDANGSGGVLSFIATAPGLGYSTYTLTFTDQPPTRHDSIRETNGTMIANVNGDTLAVEDEKLVWRRGDKTIIDLIRFFDGGDAGDVYTYCPPDPDVVVEADLVQNVQIESSPLYERLILNHRMRVASSLRPDRGRDRGLKLLELTTTVTFYDNVPGIFFRTTYENTANDHRLRAHLRTHIKSRNVLADTAFAVVQRSVDKSRETTIPETMPANTEVISNTQPLQNVIAVQNKREALALVARGLSEYEAMMENNQVTLALTLVRSVGWLSRDELHTRTGAVAPVMPVPDAQCSREIVAEYGLIPLSPNDPAALIRAGGEFNAPLRAYQYDQSPLRVERSFLSVISSRALGDQSDGEGAIVTAFKPAERGTGWIVRLFNPHQERVEVLLTPHQHPEQVHLSALSEQAEGYIETDANGRVAVQLSPNEIITIRFTF